MYDDASGSADLEYGRLCRTITGLREEAIRARADSGIEQIWTEDREHYDGIDDANRSGKWIKPRDSAGRVTREPKKKSARSSIFLNITARYVNAAAAYVCDKLIRSDVSNFGMKPTPIPDLIRQMEDKSPAMGPDGMPMQMPVMDAQGNPQSMPHMINGQPMMDQATGQPVMVPATTQATNADVAKQIMDQAKDAAEKAKTQISDWLTECGINGQSTQVVLDAALIGTGVLKGPFPEMQKSSAVIKGEDGRIQLVIEEKLVPKSRRISAWHLYPDPSCGTDIQRGKYIFESDEINARLLGELKKDPSYLSDAIDQVLEEGPMDPVNRTPKRGNKTKSEKEVFQIWYYHGYLSADDLESVGYQFEDETPEEVEPGLMAIKDESDDGEGGAPAMEGEYLEAEAEEACPCKPKRKEQYPVIVVLVNDRIIKATISPFDSGRFPYHVMRWQYRDDHWAGLGVSRQMRTSQKGVNAGVRMLHDNAGVSGAPILIIDRSKIEPADSVWSIGPHKIYYTKEDGVGDVKNVRDAFTWIIAPSMQVEMMNIIQFWMKMAEEETGMPMLLQGQTGNIEHTYGEAQILNNNGSSMLRRVTNIYDDDVTKPHIGAYYEWLLIHGEDDSMKGDFQVEAMGSSVLIERDAHSQLLGQMLGLAPNPVYGADPELIYREWLLSQRFDPEKLMLSEEKKAEMAKNQGPPPPIAVAQIREQGATQRKQMEIESKQQADQIEYAFRQHETQVQATLDALQQDGERAMNTENAKVAIARDNAKLLTQIRLAMRPQGGPQVATPPMEPQGRSPNGEAYQK